MKPMITKSLVGMSLLAIGGLAAIHASAEPTPSAPPAAPTGVRLTITENPPPDARATQNTATLLVADGKIYTYTPRRRWIEKQGSTVLREFTEAYRTKNATTIILFDPANRNNRIDFSFGTNQLNDITNRRSVPITSIESRVHAGNVTLARYNGGSFRMNGEKSWVETSATNGKKFYFVEDSRDCCNVRIVDKSRNAYVFINMISNKIFYAPNASSRPTPLYDITSSTAVEFFDRPAIPVETTP